AVGSPRGRAYVTNSGSYAVSLINTRTNAVVGSPIPVRYGPAWVATDARRGRAYVANSGSDSVSVIDTRTNAVVGSPIPVGNAPAGVALGKSLRPANH
ncbi:YncE family protein, partial [Streptomyces sp. NPDC056656]|uniref:YncE family protein n=1 Tax=Streptomyces sp. NPDC056656 TaxID=3345895 RepID=UPI0036BA6172